MRLFEFKYDFSGIDARQTVRDMEHWFDHSMMNQAGEDVILKFSKDIRYEAQHDLLLYRGIRFGQEDADSILMPLLRDHVTSVPSKRRVVSWTKDRGIAEYFSGGLAFGFLLKKMVPKEDILLDITDEELQKQYGEWMHQEIGNRFEASDYRLGTQEREVIAIKRPLENLKLCKDILVINIALRKVSLNLIYPYLEKILRPHKLRDVQELEWNTNVRSYDTKQFEIDCEWDLIDGAVQN